jgi:hypothetical protein
MAPEEELFDGGDRGRQDPGIEIDNQGAVIVGFEF